MKSLTSLNGFAILNINSLFRLRLLLFTSDPMRAFILTILFAFASVFCHATEKPNIIYILADDLGYNDLGCFGQRTLKTPHIDQLAADGMKLTRHYSGSTVCAPSRCVLMTGRHTGRASVRGNNAPHEQRGRAPALQRRHGSS